MATNGVAEVPVEKLEAALEKNKQARVAAFTKDLERLMRQHRVRIDARITIDGNGINREIVVLAE